MVRLASIQILWRLLLFLLCFVVVCGEGMDTVDMALCSCTANKRGGMNGSNWRMISKSTVVLWATTLFLTPCGDG
jgi:hypothetical protein